MVILKICELNVGFYSQHTAVVSRALGNRGVGGTRENITHAFNRVYALTVI